MASAHRFGYTVTAERELPSRLWRSRRIVDLAAGRAAGSALSATKRSFWPNSSAAWNMTRSVFRADADGPDPCRSRRRGTANPAGARLEGRMATLDTHAIARTLTDAGADPKLADAITAAVREAADHGDHVTPDQFKAGLAELEARLTWRFAGAMLAQTGVILAAVIGAAVAILRMLG